MNYIFDLDNTLIYSDYANNAAYKEAVQDVLHTDLEICGARITRADIAANFPQLSSVQMSEIVAEKEKLYAKYIGKTWLNVALLTMLKHLYVNNKRTILLTYSGKKRADNLLEFYGLSHIFTEKYYKEDFGKTSKYHFATDVLDIRPKNIVLFENETDGYRDAIAGGFVSQNIMRIV